MQKSRVGKTYDAVVIGAGQAGLAAGRALQRAGLDFVLLDAREGVGGSWPGYYDSLRLFSPARYAGLPDFPFPGDPGRHPTRDEVVRYLRAYRERFELPFAGGVRVARVERRADGFGLAGADGRRWRARSLIAATGSFHAPHVPDLPGRERFRGEVLHAAAYREPGPFAGRRGIVVGAGNSAVQIAVELAGAARVTLATREPVRFLPQRILGRDLHAWLDATGLDRAPFVKDRGGTVLDTGRYRAALRRGAPPRRPMFAGFTRDGVRWPDGSEEAVDFVLLATGYRPAHPYLEGLIGTGANGMPKQERGVSREVPGLYFVGLPNQSSLRSATLRGVGPDAERVVRHLAAHRLPAGRPSGRSGRAARTAPFPACCGGAGGAG